MSVFLTIPVEVVAGEAVVAASLQVERGQVESGMWVVLLLEQVVCHLVGDELGGGRFTREKVVFKYALKLF